MSSTSFKTGLHFADVRPKWNPFEALVIGFSGTLALQLLVVVITLNVPIFSNFFGSNDPLAVSTQRLIASLAALGLCWFTVKTHGQSWSALGWRKIKWRSILSVIPAYILYFAFSTLIFVVIYGLWPQLDLGQSQNLGFSTTANFNHLILIYSVLVIATPFFEETVFRGFIFGGLRTGLGFWPAALLSSALFGWAHFQLNVGLDTFVLALVLCWLYEHQQSLIPAILLHILKNTVAFFLVFVF